VPELFERVLTQPEIHHLIFKETVAALAALFFLVMGVLNLKNWGMNLGKPRKKKREIVGLALQFLVCLLIFLFGYICGGSAWLISRDLVANRAAVFSSMVSDHRMAHGKGRPAYYLDFGLSAPITELEVSQTIYDEFQTGSPVTVSYAPHSRNVLDVNGQKAYR
jgi:hypothetical protein